ncbi:MAG: histidine phosphatase family protein [Clostridia bacterium]|nr:histidine phosphatase family protein [Clostridia bacterium]
MRNDDVFLQLYLIRHAESMGNIETDESFDVMNPPLTLHGLMQASRLAERFKGIKIEKVYTSPLERAISTALPVSENCSAEFVFDTDLVEKDVCISMKGFSLSYESDELCKQRAKKFINHILKMHTDCAVAVVAHGEILQYLIREALGISDSDVKFCVYNTSVTKINFRKDKANKAAFINDISHLISLDGDKTEWM